MKENQTVADHGRENVTVSNVSPNSEACGLRMGATTCAINNTPPDDFKVRLAGELIKEAIKGTIELETALRFCKLIFEAHE